MAVFRRPEGWRSPEELPVASRVARTLYPDLPSAAELRAKENAAQPKASGPALLKDKDRGEVSPLGGKIW